MNQKEFTIVVIISVLLGVFGGFASSNHSFFYIILILITLFGIAIFLLLFIRTLKVSNFLNILQKNLHKDLDLDKYISELEMLLTKSSNNLLRKYSIIFLSEGYEMKGNYEKSIELLKNIYINGESSLFKATYFNNLSYYYCEIGDVENALKAYKEGEKYINKFIQNPRLSIPFIDTKGVVEFLKGNLKEAEVLLDKVKTLPNTTNHLTAGANIYLAKIYIASDRIDEARELMEYNLSQLLFPNVMIKTKNIIAEIDEKDRLDRC